MSQDTTPRQRHVVFVLGAGASKEAGCPLLNDFFKVGGELYATKRLGSVAEDYEVIETLRQKLIDANARADVDIDNLESVFNAFEMMDTLDMASTILERDPTHVRRHFVQGISGVLMSTLRFPLSLKPGAQKAGAQDPTRILYDSDSLQYASPPGYRDLAVVLRHLLASPVAYEITIITFNYDVALELSLTIEGILFDYGFGWRGPQDARVHILKLHGSVNWMAPVAESVAPLHHESPSNAKGGCQGGASSTFVEWVRQLVVINPDRLLKVPVGQYSLNELARFPTDVLLDEMKASGIEGSCAPMIVPPAESKVQSRKLMSAFWQFALGAMSEAECIIVSGYSLPSTDQFFKHLYVLSGLYSKPVVGFWVYDPCGHTRARFRHLVAGQAAKNFVEMDLPFSAGMGHLAEVYLSRRHYLTA